MHSRFRMKGVLLAALVAVLASVALPHSASAEPQPGAKKKGFRLFARALGAMTINRIYCGLSSAGQICVDSTNSSTIGGGFWPKGTPDQYIFNSGLQVAGTVGPDGGVWAGDTVGGFFFDPKGTTEHGEEVQPIYNASNPADLAIWPEAACVPFGDGSADLFNPLLQTDPTSNDPNYSYQCRKSASQGDIWFMSWEGNPALRAGRKHPLGVVVETRGMGWNFPAGNEDILYYIYTFYNITSTNAADYAAYRPSIRSILLQKAADFRTAVAATGVTLPAPGYTMTNLFAAFARDDDVAEAGSNYSSVNLPFALGFTYDHSFGQPAGWKFDPSIFSDPFFPGSGFTGAKYLKSPTGPGAIQLFSNTINGQPFAGAVNDPRDVTQLFRYLSGTLSPVFGDQSCNTGNPAVSRVCFVNNTSPQDMRFFQSSTPLTLGPGQSGSIVVAYIMAAPVKTGGCSTSCDVKPGDPLRMTDAFALQTEGANTVDSITGFRGYTDANIDGVVEQSEVTVVPGSLLGKALVAQSVFDNKFLLPFAPTAPEFFLIPGDNQVTVLWKPSASEASGDPFYAIANAAKVTDPNSGSLVNNALYDPNYRQFDVEGYRIYRGRVDAPNELQLLAQFDYAGTVISDYTGIVNPSAGCAPEFGVTPSCPVAFEPNRKDGTTLTEHVDYDLVGPIIQVNAGSGRTGLAVGKIDTVIAAIDSTVSPPDTTFTTVFIPSQAQILKADTLITGGGTNGSCGPRSSCPELANTGVPFVFIDRTPRNNFRYFYSVTAFDVNSIESGPTSLESPRNTRSVRPVAPADNFTTSGTLSTEIFGRGAAAASRPLPSLDPSNGTFSGPMPPADGTTLAFAGELASAVVGKSGLLAAKLDSLKMGQTDLSGCCSAGQPGIPAQYFWRVFTATDTFHFNYAVQQDFTNPGADNRFFNVLNTDSALSDKYGGNNSFVLYGQQVVNVPQSSFLGGWGLAFALGAAGLNGNDRYNGYRWFDGPSPANNETQANPTAGNCGTGTGACSSTTSFNNAGKVTGAVTVYQPREYITIDREWRNMSQSLSSAVRAADFNLYWGANGAVDSIIDITHNVEVRFDSTNIAGSGYGFLNVAGQAAPGSFDGRTGVVTLLDWTCVEPFRSILTQPANGFYPCTSAAPFNLSATAVPGPIALGAGSQQTTTAAQSVRNPGNVQPNNGISLYLAGTITFFELNGGALPAAGTVWTLRTYSGNIRGGHGGGPGNLGNYTFQSKPRPFTAVGAELHVAYNVVNNIGAPKYADLKSVHTVPDPYYVTNGYETTTDSKIIKFVNLPDKAIIRIYSSSGVLVNLLENPGPNCQNVNLSGKPDNPTGGECTWNVRNRNNQVVASGVYFYHIESNSGGGTARRVGRMTIVNFAQ